jgi:hypothetical protein
VALGFWEILAMWAATMVTVSICFWQFWRKREERSDCIRIKHALMAQFESSASERFAVSALRIPSGLMLMAKRLNREVKHEYEVH